MWQRRPARRDRTLSRGTPEAEDLLAQYVARYRPGDAARYLDQVRARVSSCRPGGGRSVRIVAQRFAGQDALLVQADYGDGFTAKHVLVRQGDLLTEFFTKPERSSAAAQELGRRARAPALRRHTSLLTAYRGVLMLHPPPMGPARRPVGRAPGRPSAAAAQLCELGRSTVPDGSWFPGSIRPCEPG